MLRRRLKQFQNVTKRSEMDIAGLLNDVVKTAKERKWSNQIFGGGVKGAALRGLLGADPPEDASAREMDVYRNFANASMAMAAGPLVAVKGAKAAKAASGATKEAKTVNSPVFGRYDPRAVPDVEQSIPPRYNPARGAPEHIKSLLENEVAYKQAKEWAQAGMTNEGVGWYNMEPLRKQFVKELGKNEGQKAFDQYIDLMAATSAGARTTDNARIASYYYVKGADGLPVAIPEKGSGYGHKAQVLHNASANKILEGGGLDPIKNPKRYTFAENLRGNVEGVTVDKHNVRAWGMASKDPAWITTKFEDPAGIGKPSWWDEAKFGQFDPKMNPREFVVENKIPWHQIPPTWFKGAPNANEYAALEALNTRLSNDLGVRPAQGQAALWLGAGPTTGLGSPPMSMMNTLDQVLAKRAAARGQTPQEVLSEFIRKQRPLSVLIPAAGVGAGVASLLDDETY